MILYVDDSLLMGNHAKKLAFVEAQHLEGQFEMSKLKIMHAHIVSFPRNFLFCEGKRSIFYTKKIFENIFILEMESSKLNNYYAKIG
jgi:hypothetical protein